MVEKFCFRVPLGLLFLKIMTMSDFKEDKNMQDVCDLLQASRTHKLFIPEVDRSGTLTELQSEMLSWIWNVDSREHANSDSPTGLTDLQKEMLRWISHSNSIQIAMHNKPSTPEKIDDVHTVTLANIVTVVKEDTDGYVDVEEISSKHVHDQSIVLQNQLKWEFRLTLI